MMNHIDLSRTDLNLLVLFEAVMTEQHVGRAAERLNLTGSAVSHGLKRLRALLGDPLFLKTPRGVVPTERASELAPAIVDVLGRVRSVVSTTKPFDPQHSTRRFLIGAPDGVASVLLAPLLELLRKEAPGIDIGIQQLLPKEGATSLESGWSEALNRLDARQIDIAIIPFSDVPARFTGRTLYEEGFSLAMRKGHPFARRPTIDGYCGQKHLVVSHSADPHGNVDMVLAERGLSRRVSLTVPNFHFALAILAESDLIAALPSRFVSMHGRRYNVVAVEPPMDFPTYKLTMVLPRVALMDTGLAWFVNRLESIGASFGDTMPTLFDRSDRQFVPVSHRRSLSQMG